MCWWLWTESNSWDIRHPDLASGGREDGLVTTDQLRKHKCERVMGCWRFGEKEGSKENINDLTEARMDFSSVSLEPYFTAAQSVDRIGEKKRLLIPPREFSTYA